MPVDDVNHLDVPESFRIPLVVPFSPREYPWGSKDSTIQNAFVEPKPDGRKYVVKRPGINPITSFDGGGAATAQGFFRYNGFTLGVYDNRVTRIASLSSAGYTTGAAWGNVNTAPWKGRSAFACVVFNNQIFVIGGTYDGINALRDVWASADGTEWTQLTGVSPWGERFHQEAVVLNNRLYLMGGVNNGVFYNDVWVTDDGVQWTLVTGNAAWAPRSGFCLMAFNNGMYLVGGNVSGTEVWFSLDGNNWALQVTGVFAGNPKAGSIGVVHNNAMFILGGAILGREVWSSTDGRTWTLLTNVAYSSARYDMGAVSYNGRIYVSGGFGAAELTEVWSSADGVAWVQNSAAYGGAGIAAHSMAVFRAPAVASSPINAPVMYIIGGRTAVPTYLALVWYASIDGTLSTTYALSGAATPYLPMSGTSVNANQYFAMKDTRSLWVWYADQWELIADPNYPIETVPGICNLDETVYVMTPDGLICGSSLTNPRVWPSLNFIGADFTADGGSAICRYGNYVLAFGPETFQLFYNSGAPGRASLLRPMKSSSTNIGCSFPYSVVEMENTVVWIGRAEGKGNQVFALQGQTAVPISTTSVEMVLDLTTNTIRGEHIKINGHPYYILSCATWSFGAMVYDFLTKLWYVWDNAGAAWRYSYSGTDGDTCYLLLNNRKELLAFDPAEGSDDGDSIRVLIRTNPEDQGNNRLKFIARATAIGDWVSGVTSRLRWSDNDGNTWSNWRTINNYQQRPSTMRLGSYRRRMWEYEHDSAVTTNWRTQAIEVELNLGK